MTIGMNLRKIVSGAVLALTISVVPVAAQANDSAAADDGTAVCNVRGNGHRGGELVAFDADANDATGLRAMPGNGKGLLNAAGNSPALTLCGTLGASGWNATGT